MPGSQIIGAVDVLKAYRSMLLIGRPVNLHALRAWISVLESGSHCLAVNGSLIHSWIPAEKLCRLLGDIICNFTMWRCPNTVGNRGIARVARECRCQSLFTFMSA